MWHGFLWFSPSSRREVILYIAWLSGLLFLSTKPRLCKGQKQRRTSDKTAACDMTAEMGSAGPDGPTALPTAPTLHVLLLPWQGTGHVPTAEMDMWKQKASFPQHSAHMDSIRPSKKPQPQLYVTKPTWHGVLTLAAVLVCCDNSVLSLMLFSWTSSDGFRDCRET